LMKQVYGDDCLSRSRVQRFQSGREDINDDEQCGPTKIRDHRKFQRNCA